jgi:hypothetical protein
MLSFLQRSIWSTFQNFTYSYFIHSFIFTFLKVCNFKLHNSGSVCICQVKVTNDQQELQNILTNIEVHGKYPFKYWCTTVMLLGEFNLQF